MYDTITSTLLFVLLVPGFILTLPPGGVTAVVIHAIIFYLVQVYLPAYVPAWGIWIIVFGAIALKIFRERSAVAPTY